MFSKLVSHGCSSRGRYDVNLSADQTMPDRGDLEQTIDRLLLSRQQPVHLLLITRTLQNCRTSCKIHAAISTLYLRLIQKLKVFPLIYQMQLAFAHTIELQRVLFFLGWSNQRLELFLDGNVNYMEILKSEKNIKFKKVKEGPAQHWARTGGMGGRGAHGVV